MQCHSGLILVITLYAIYLWMTQKAFGSAIIEVTQSPGSYRSEKSNYDLIKLRNLRPHEFDEICRYSVLDALYLLHIISTVEKKKKNHYLFFRAQPVMITQLINQSLCSIYQRHVE